MARLPRRCTAFLAIILAGEPAMAAAESTLQAPEAPAPELARIGAYLQSSVDNFPIGDYLGYPNGREGPVGGRLFPRLRHAQIVMHGTPTSGLDYSMRLDATRLQLALTEGYASVRGGPWRLAVGRIRAPLGAEFLADDWDLPAIDRALHLRTGVGRGPAFPGFGALTGDALQATVEHGRVRLLTWGGREDVANRFEVRPSSSLALGATYLASNPLLPQRNVQTGSRTGAAVVPAYRDRWGADVRWQDGPVTVAAEFMRGYDMTDVGGIFGLGAFQYLLWDLGGGHQVLLRHEDLRQDTDFPASNGAGPAFQLRTGIVGWTWVPPGTRSKLQLEYARRYDGYADDDTITGALGIKL